MASTVLRRRPAPLRRGRTRPRLQGAHWRQAKRRRRGCSGGGGADDDFGGEGVCGAVAVVVVVCGAVAVVVVAVVTGTGWPSPPPPGPLSRIQSTIFNTGVAMVPYLL